MNDIVFDPIFFVFDVPEDTPGGTVQGYSFDGDNFAFSSTTGAGGEVSSVFIS